MKTIRYILTLVLVLVAMAWAASDQNTFDNGIYTPFISERHARNGVSFDDKKITNILSISEDLSIFDATTSAQLLGVISDETGTGAAVFATNPTLVTPVLGVATGTSFQGVVGNVTPAAGTFTTLTSTALIAPEGTPVNAVASQGTITMAGVAIANETFVVDTQTFTWKAARAVLGEVTIGATAAAAVTNIVTAITADIVTVTAVDGAGDTVTLTAATAGVAGNALVLTEASTNMTVDGAGTLGTTTAGVDGTVAVANELKADATYLYHAVLANTIADANWRRIALGAAY